jgi:hypothetical protein
LRGSSYTKLRQTMRLLPLLALVLVLSCAPSRQQSEPAAQPEELRLDTPSVAPTPATPTDTTAARTDTAAQSKQQDAAAKPKRLPKPETQTAAPASEGGVEVRTTKKPREGVAAPQQSQPTQPEEGGVEVRTEKKKRTP